MPYMVFTCQSTNWIHRQAPKSFGRLNQTSLSTDVRFRKKRQRLRSYTTGHSTSTLVSIPIACSLTSSVTQLTDTAAMPTVTNLRTAGEIFGYKELCLLADALKIFENNGYDQVYAWCDLLDNTKD